MMSIMSKRTATRVLMFLACVTLPFRVYAQGLLPTPDNEYRGIAKYEPKRSAEIIRKIVNGNEVYEVKIVDGPLPKLPPAVDLTPFAPPVGTQSFGDCTAWATAYCCLTTQNAKARSITNPSTDVNLFSPRFVYSQINGGVDKGSYIFRSGNDPAAVKLLQDKGCSSNLLTPYLSANQNSNGWSVTPSSVAFVESANYPLFHHAICETIDDIRYSLVFGIPVVIAVHHENRFYSHSGASLFKWQGGKDSRHAMCIIGYDNSLQAFRVQNSWGTNWGDQGRFWVGFDHFDKLKSPTDRDNGWCYEAHALVLSPSQGTQLRTTPKLNLSTFFIPDGSVIVQGSNSELASPGTFRAVETTDYYLYAVTGNGGVRAYNGTSWLDVSSSPWPGGLNGGKATMLAASKKFLYAITKNGNVVGRVPSDISSTGSAYWEKISLPNSEVPLDIRNRSNEIYVEAESGKLYQRIVGSGWSLVN